MPHKVHYLNEWIICIYYIAKYDVFSKHLKLTKITFTFSILIFVYIFENGLNYELFH